MSIFNLTCPHNNNKECEHCHGITAQDGWRFKGCFCSPFKGKFVAEIKECRFNDLAYYDGKYKK